MVALLPLALAFILIALGELGDKTQLLVVTLSARHPRWAVLAGAIAAEAAMAAVAVAVGLAAAQFLPGDVISIAAAVAFMGVGVWLVLRRRSAPVLRQLQPRHAFLATAALIAVGEMGDKTQLAIIALAAQYQALWEVFVGAVLGEVLMMGVGVAVGDQLGRRLKLDTIRLVSALVFVAIGVLILLSFLWFGG